MSGMAGERKGLSPPAFVGALGVAAGERNGLPSIMLAAIAGTKDVALEGGGGKVIFTRGFACEWKGLSSTIVLDAPGVAVEDTNDGEFLFVGVWAELW